MNQVHQLNNRDYNYSEPPVYGFQPAENQMVHAAERIDHDNRLKERREKTARAFRIIIVLLLFVIFIQVVYHLYFARNIKIEKVVIEAGAGIEIGDEQILDMAGITGNESYFAVNPEIVAARLQRFPQISEAAVSKKFPDTLNIVLEGRTPLAVCLIEAGGRVVPAAVDEDGVIFQIGRAVTQLDLPVVSGIKIDEARVGAVMPEAVTGFLACLSGLRMESPSFFNSISELRILRKSNDDFEVLMYPQNYSIPVRMGNRIDKELFTYILLVLDVAEQQGMSDYLEELDFRTDEVVYKLRGE